MITYTLRDPTEEDLDQLASNMRPVDVLECRVVAGLAPRAALAQAVKDSLWSVATLVEGRVIAVFGLAAGDLLDSEGTPWLLSANGIEHHAKVVMSVSSRFKERMLAEFETLSNVVHADNRQAIRYLKWCGFSFGDAFDISGEPFLPFEMKRAA